jgi:hypothetical protein
MPLKIPCELKKRSSGSLVPRKKGGLATALRLCQAVRVVGRRQRLQTRRDRRGKRRGVRRS